MKHLKFTSSINEWSNSIYNFNYNKLNAIVWYKTIKTHILLNSYFNLKKSIPKKSLSYNLYNISILSRSINYLIKNQTFNLKKKKLFLKWKLNNLLYIKFINGRKNMVTNKSLKRLFVSSPYIKHTNNTITLLLFIFNKNKNLLINKIKKLHKIIIKKINMRKKNPNLIVKIKKDILLKRYYLANIYLNNLKFNELNFINLKNILNKIYNKNIIINTINIKYFYLENNILIDAITRKLNDRKKKVLWILKKTLRLVKLAKYVHQMNIIKENINKYLHISLLGSANKYSKIISSLRNKHIVGMYLEAKGRLTKRMTASRAIYKLKFRGNMKDSNLNIDKNFTTLKRGYIKSNMIHNSNNSYNKNGSFGISSKVNTY